MNPIFHLHIYILINNMRTDGHRYFEIDWYFTQTHAHTYLYIHIYICMYKALASCGRLAKDEQEGGD